MPPNREYWWSTKQPQVTDLPTVWLPVTSERYWASFQVTRLFHKATVSHCDHFLLLHMYLLFETSPGWLQGWRGFFFFFLPRFGGGPLSSNVFTICAVYWSLGGRGYFGVLNVVLVHYVPIIVSWNFSGVPTIDRSDVHGQRSKVKVTEQPSRKLLSERLPFWGKIPTV